MAALDAKSQGFGVQLHSNLHVVVILSKTERAAQQKWGTEISVQQCKIVPKYRYNHIHDTYSIHKVLRILATSEASRDCRKGKAPRKLADMVIEGMTRLQRLVQQKPAPQYNYDISKESANVSTTMDSEGPIPRRGRCKKKEKERRHSRRSPFPSTSQSPLPPVRRKRTTSCRANRSTKMGQQ